MSKISSIVLAFLAAVAAAFAIVYFLPAAAHVVLPSEGETLEIPPADAGAADIASDTASPSSVSGETSPRDAFNFGGGVTATASDVASKTATAISSTTSAVRAATTTVLAPPLPSCSVAAALASSTSLASGTLGSVIINEVAWMGSVPRAGETAAAAGNREWIELKNISSAKVDLARWQLLDEDGDIKVGFGAADAIAPRGFFLLARGTATGTADRVYSGILANSGDALVLFDGHCKATDVVNASLKWPAGDNTTKQTLERNADAKGWHTSVPRGGTPRAENSVPVLTSRAASSSPSSGSNLPTASGGTSAAAATDSGTDTGTDPPPPDPCPTFAPLAHLVIAEVQIAGTSTAEDFVRIFNPTKAAVDLGGWKLRKKTKTGTDNSLRALASGLVIPSGGYFTWANGTGDFAARIGAHVTSSETLAADNSVALLNASGTVVDALAWGGGTNQYGEGEPYPENPDAGKVLGRRSESGIVIDTNENALDFTLYDGAVY